MLDRFRQRHRRRNHPRRSAARAGHLPLARGSGEDTLLAMPAITEPVQLALMGPLDRHGHGLLDQILAQRATGAGHDEATVPVLDQASPAFSLVMLTSCPLFFWTTDH